jgi:regulator of ribonuclease activity A
MKTRTTDLCDKYFPDLQIAAPIFRDYGGKLDFEGPMVTVRTYEDNVIVRQILEEPGNGRVLVVDGGGSLRRAILGDHIAEIAFKSGWAGVLINGCIRDIAGLSKISIGIKALNAIPLRPLKAGVGERDTPVTFAGVTFIPGHYLYADEDGVVVSSKKLELG